MYRDNMYIYKKISPSATANSYKVQFNLVLEYAGRDCVNSLNLKPISLKYKFRITQLSKSLFKLRNGFTSLQDEYAGIQGKARNNTFINVNLTNLNISSEFRKFQNSLI